jgi:hypothetical protein
MPDDSTDAYGIAMLVSSLTGPPIEHNTIWVNAVPTGAKARVGHGRRVPCVWTQLGPKPSNTACHQIGQTATCDGRNPNRIILVGTDCHSPLRIPKP